MASTQPAGQQVIVNSKNLPFYHTLTNNSTKAALDTLACTTTEPVTTDSSTPTSNTLVVDMNGGTHVHVMPYGTNAANEAGNIRVVGWKSIRNSVSSTICWVPQTLWQSLITLGTMTGVDGSSLEDENFLADTIADDTSALNDHVVSRADNGAASILIDCRGCEKVEVDFDLTTAASLNALVAVL